MFNQFAPAKLNLYLHITGRRTDGYHDLDSLVAFAGVGDEIRLESAAAFSLKIEGPQATLLQSEPLEGNLVAKVAQSLAELTGNPLDVALTLIKNLPVASGIGGGSSDAAAALRALAHHWHLAPSDPRIHQAALKHGQDVPVCLDIANNFITASGTEPAPELPHTDLLLVNPNKALPTPAVYKEFREGGYKFSPRAQFDDAPEDVSALVDLLKARTNDLSAPAIKLMPEIGVILTELEKSASLLARMSGSGATCFGIYADRGAARKAASDIMTAHPTWWVVPTSIPCTRF